MTDNFRQYLKKKVSFPIHVHSNGLFKFHLTPHLKPCTLPMMVCFLLTILEIMVGLNRRALLEWLQNYWWRVDYIILSCLGLTGTKFTTTTTQPQHPQHSANIPQLAFLVLLRVGESDWIHMKQSNLADWLGMAQRLCSVKRQGFVEINF